MRISILIPTFQPNDAVGNDALGMLHMLREAGYETSIYAQFVHAAHEKITRVLSSENDIPQGALGDILIYHHAIDWDMGERILARTRGKIVIKYHNVTPPDFYSRYSDHYYWACVRGVEATRRLALIPNTWIWGDSRYNANEFVALGAPEERCNVVAPIHRIEQLASEPFDAVVAGRYRGGAANIMFVGGIRPNKGHLKALEVFRAYKDLSDTPARLLFVGNYDPNLKSYKDELSGVVAEYGFEDDEVVFATSVSPAQLRSFYMTATVFLCVSEHEGFCVPLVEAMAFRAPIAAWATTAVGETAGGCGWIVDRYDPEALAQGVAEIIDNPAAARDYATRGRDRYENVFHTDAIRRSLIDLVEEVARA
jgi:glycosyltransferase involved in cell wall biosynthesis